METPGSPAGPCTRLKAMGTGEGRADGFPYTKNMSGMGRWLLGLGCCLMMVGALMLLAAGRLHLPLGRLPGDLHWKSRHMEVWLPLGTSLLLSVLLSLGLALLRYLRR